MSGRLDDKVAVVIGAGSIGPGWGNGKAAAVLFAREGAKVLCVDINQDAANETVQIIDGEGGQADAIQADASQAIDVERVMAACVERFGRLDILENNVGIAEVGDVVETSEESFDRVLAVNLKSCFLAMKHAIPIMERQGGGAIVNISSVASLGHSGVSYAGYYASKAAMNHLTATTAVDFAAKGIRVNAVLPGLMKTPMVAAAVQGLAARYGAQDVEEMWKARDAQVPMGHMGDAWDIAHAALFLASDEARYITGVALAVDGGVTLKFN
ncbi:MAG TPA: SDR family oxidoreductase [Solirubrobacteraceae bacterium]|jgi:NAD(P)-dependent dehydrogenase (short-subunit alcohol dehydrogenase family)|nr:SDR family oxidoreductase [Solirubrobacteraceae bacterium]